MEINLTKDLPHTLQVDPNGNPTETDQHNRPQPSPSREMDQSEDGVWSITLEQFLATMLTEASLEDYFNKQVPIMASLEALRQRDRLQSVS